MRLTGAQIILECLKEQGVDTIFGFPGGTILPLYDALFQCAEIDHFLTCHEQHAAHAADGYSRATGRPGVVFATSGPGSTNLVTGIATAYMDSVPLIAITANVVKANLGKDSFQEVDITGVTTPITKHNMIVKDMDDLAEAVREAFFIAMSGRPGPVLIDVPKDLTTGEAEYRRRAPVAPDRCDDFWPSDLEEAAQIANSAARPFIIAGGGIITAGAEKELWDLADALHAPIATTLMGIGGYPEDSENYTGMIGMHGSKASAECVLNSDVIIAIGMRFADRVISDRSKFAPQAKIIHIDVDPAEINKNIPAFSEIIGNAKDVLVQLLPRIEKKEDRSWLDQVIAWKKEYPIDKPAHNARYPKRILETMQRCAPEDTIFTTEVGQHQMWAAQFLKINHPRQFITSGGLGTMGFGLGAAIGAAVGTGKPVVNIAGDGSFMMNLQELRTAVRYNLPVTVLILNNHVLGMVRQWQTLFYDKRYAQTTLDAEPNYEMLAAAFGARGYHVKDPAQLDATMERAFSEGGGPALVVCDIHEDESVLPMIPGGAGFEEIIIDLENS